jgi:hypothetical protein
MELNVEKAIGLYILTFVFLKGIAMPDLWIHIMMYGQLVQGKALGEPALC